MATQAHCAYCFEALAASFDNQKPAPLSRIEQLWDEYTQQAGDDSADHDDAEEEDGSSAKKDTKSSLAKISASLKSRATSSPSAASNNSSTPSLQSKGSSSTSSSANAHETPASSASASETSLPHSPLPPSPLFITWNTVSGRGSKQLRGCIGTFEAQEIEHGLYTYALTSAFEDTRFNPIARSELPTLSADVTLLTDFEPAPDPLAWTLGTHGIRLSFMHAGRRMGATFLPNVAPEQGWSKEETMVALMRKAGWSGRAQEWTRVRDMKVVRYQGRKVSVGAEAWRAFRQWCEARGAL